MTRKDYELIASVFADYSKVCELSETIGEGIAKELANAFAFDNPRFNPQRFLKACGLEVGK